MANLQPLLPRKISQSVFAPIAPPVDAPPAVDLSGMNSGTNPLGTIAPPTLRPVVNPEAQQEAANSAALVNRTAAASADYDRRSHPVKPTTTLGKIGHVASNIGNVLGNIFAPGPMSLIHGTQLNNEVEKNRDLSVIGQASKLQNEAAQRKQEAALTVYTEQRPEIEQAKIRQHLMTSLAPKGFTVTDNPVSPGGFDIAQDPDSPYTKKLNALATLQDAQAERTQLQSENLANKYQPGTPQYEEWNRKLEQADERMKLAMAGLGLRRESLGLTRDNYLANNLGVDSQGNPLPGSLVTDTGQPVGSRFSTNVRPTSQERKVGDLAQSAVNQVHTMRQIIHAHPEIFGPVAGRTTSAEAWLGSQSPDAQKFLSASRYLADHSAGVFGSRSVEITKSLEQLTNPQSNPDALNAALDTAESTAQHFVNAGKVRTEGDGDKRNTPAAGSATPPKGATGKAKGSDGRMYWVDSSGKNYGVAQ